MRVLLTGLFTYVVSLVGPVGLLVADDVLHALPAETAMVVRLASPNRYLGNVQHLLTSVGGPAAGLAATQEAALAQLLFERQAELNVLDRSAPAYVAAFVLPGGHLAAARFVAPADETALRRAVLGAAEGQDLTAEAGPGGFERVTAGGRNVYFGRCAGMTVYTDREELAQRLAEGPNSTLGTACPPAVIELLTSGDVGLLINAGHLVETYAPQIDQGRAEVLRAIGQIPPEATGLQAEQAGQVKEAVQAAAQGVFDAMRDARWVGVRLNLAASGVTAAALLTVAEGSPTAALLALNPPSGLDALGLLPAGAPVYYAARPLHGERLKQLGRRLSSAYTQARGETPEAQAALAEAERLAGESGLQSVAGSFGWPLNPTTGMITYALSEAENPAALLEAQAKQHRAAGVVRTATFSERIEYQPAAEQLDERPVDLSIHHVEAGTGQDEATIIVNALLERLYGGRSLQTRFTVLEGVLAEARGNDPRFLQQLVAGLASGEGLLGLDAGFAACRDALAPQANVILMLNLPQMVTDGVRAIRDVPPFNLALAQLPFNFNLQPGSSYAGLSLTAEAEGLRVHLHVPAAQARGMLQIFARSP